MAGVAIKEGVTFVASQDAMEVRAVFPETEELNFEDFAEAVSHNNFYGYIDNGHLKKAFNNRTKERNPIILSGKPPVDGRDGAIYFHFDVEHKGEVQSVSEGQVLATIIPGEAGIDGINVYGRRVPARKGKMPTFPRGRNTEISEDKFLLYSKIDGRVEFVDSKVNVDRVYVVDGDLDRNVSFVGDVIVKGNVLSRYSIKAKGKVEIYGVVEGASIDASGDIDIRKGIVGSKRCAIKCGSNITAKFIEHATVYAKGDITVGVILHGNVDAQGSITVKGRKGQIIGGRIRAGGDITAQSIGTSMHVPTYVEVGVDIAVAQKCVQLERKIEQLQKTVPNYRRFKTMPTILKNEMNALAIEHKGYRERAYLDNKSKIHATKEIHPGTVIVVKGVSRTLNKLAVNTTFFLSENGSIRKLARS